jgi:hypothetical protein
MEYLDGEGTASSRAAVAAHLAACAACQAFVADQQGLSRELGAWHVPPAPETLRAPAAAAPPRRWRPTRYMLAGLSTAAAALIVMTYQARFAAPRSGVAHDAREETSAVDKYAAIMTMPGPAAPSGAAAGGGLPSGRVAGSRQQAAPLPATPPESGTVADGLVPARALIRTATLQVVATDFTVVRAAVERVVAGAGGFADQMSVSADPGSARVLHATLRVPGDRLADTLARLRGLGQVTADQQSAEDVSDQLVDLDARLHNARATEQRLSDILRQRTGKLSDVLEVEQEIARVRLQVEQLDAQKANMGRRVAYASIEVTVSEARKAGLDPGPLPLPTQLRVAFADGLQTVVDTLVGAMLFALRAGPTLTLWLVAGAGAWVAVKRLRRRARTA